VIVATVIVATVIVATMVVATMVIAAMVIATVMIVAVIIAAVVITAVITAVVITAVVIIAVVIIAVVIIVIVAVVVIAVVTTVLDEVAVALTDRNAGLNVIARINRAFFAFQNISGLGVVDNFDNPSIFDGFNLGLGPTDRNFNRGIAFGLVGLDKRIWRDLRRDRQGWQGEKCGNQENSLHGQVPL
jgi:hypothetical protein